MNYYFILFHICILSILKVNCESGENKIRIIKTREQGTLYNACKITHICVCITIGITISTTNMLLDTLYFPAIIIDVTKNAANIVDAFYIKEKRI